MARSATVLKIVILTTYPLHAFKFSGTGSVHESEKFSVAEIDGYPNIASWNSTILHVLYEGSEYGYQTEGVSFARASSPKSGETYNSYDESDSNDIAGVFRGSYSYIELPNAILFKDRDHTQRVYIYGTSYNSTSGSGLSWAAKRGIVIACLLYTSPSPRD